MASIWFWLFVSVGSLIGGAMTMAFILLVWNFFRDKYIKRKLPKDKKEISEYIKVNQDFFKTRKKEIQDIKEVEENERRKQQQFREFEKLRRFATKTGKGRSDGDTPTGRNELPTGNILPNESDKESSTPDPDIRRKVRLD